MPLLLVGTGFFGLLTARRAARIGAVFERRLRGHSDWPVEWYSKGFAAACFLLALLIAVGVLRA
jgi:hypothetical protein